MYVYSTQTATGMFHEEWCPHAKRMHKENKAYSESKERLLAMDMKECACCHQVYSPYKKALASVECLLNSHSLRMEIIGKDFYVISPIHVWKIIGWDYGTMCLYRQLSDAKPNRNTKGRKLARLRFMQQCTSSSTSLAWLVDYSGNHDAWTGRAFETIPFHTDIAESPYCICA